MINSMTGFGRCEISEAERKYTIEIKGINHRYLDINMRMPKKFNMFDSSIRTLIKKYIQRGKVDLYITYEDSRENQLSLKYNQALATEYMNYFKQIEEDFSIPINISASYLSRYPEVFTMEEQKSDEQELWDGLKKAMEGALEQFTKNRASEGEHLKADIIIKLDEMIDNIAHIETRFPEIIAEHRKKLDEKLKELLGDVQLDEARLAMEVVIFADKICTDEEIVRLKSHITHMRSALETGTGIGRKLDFITQEMNREANTILSKANNLDISNYAIDLKTAIEKIREQIQNIE